MTSPAPFRDAPQDQLRAVNRLYFDVDDTLTYRGFLPEEAVSALYAARDAGLHLVAVTGRSAAWGEMLLRIFPLDAVIAETGAVCFCRPPGKAVSVMHAEPDEGVRADNKLRREKAAKAVLAEVETARLALDNLGREYDVAFDLIEDGPPVPKEDAAKIRGMLEEHGLSVAQSSVHINAWFGTFDKATMVDRYLREIESTSLEEAAAQLVYVGDSTNDGAMFARTPLAVGVGNIRPHLEQLQERNQAPAYLVEDHGGHGFAQIVDVLVAARTQTTGATLVDDEDPEDEVPATEVT